LSRGHFFASLPIISQDLHRQVDKLLVKSIINSFLTKAKAPGPIQANRTTIGMRFEEVIRCEANIQSLRGHQMDTFMIIAQLVEKGQIQEAKEATQKALEVEKIPAMEILNRGLIAGLDAVGKAFACQKAFVPELMTAGMAMKVSLDLLRPVFETSDATPKGTVVIGTVEGDVHDVGKNIVAMMLQGPGSRSTTWASTSLRQSSSRPSSSSSRRSLPFRPSIRPPALPWPKPSKPWRAMACGKRSR